jgi:hypothetical protein
MLLKTAMKLEETGADYWIIIFTDREELAKGQGLEKQGSFALAEYLKRGGLAGARMFIFDACGAGDTLVISSTTDYLLKDETGAGILKARQTIQGLRNLALDTARYLVMDRVLLAPTPFSDDAGFLKAGFPAQTITVLPGKEAASLVSHLRLHPEFAGFLISRSAEGADRLLIPKTWRSLNGPSDSHLLLTAEHYHRIIRFAAALCAG